MRYASIAGSFVACALVLAAAFPVSAQDGSTPTPAVSLIPQPVSVQTGSATYALPSDVSISATAREARDVGAFAIAFLRSRGIRAHYATGGQPELTLDLRTSRSTPSEAYTLNVAQNGAVISASSGAGLYYGLQTFEQLFDPATKSNVIPQVRVQDAPRFKWRGIHLDVSRHFWDVPTVKRYIDVASHYKLNVFHWHLTDDQGWRLELKKYPRLTTVGSCRAGTQAGHDAREINVHRYCGYYTQTQIRDVVAYAKQRYMTIVPEVEMPGHSSAAIAAYPWLGCSGKPAAVSTTWGGSTPVCPTERAIKFEEAVLDELISLFPGTYVHTGGDEVPYSQWKRSSFVTALMKREHLQTYPQVQGYFERRIEAYIRSRGRRMVGWDEILDGGVSTTATVMSWRGTEGGVKGAKRGNDVVMTPDGPLYFDAYQGDPDDEPVAIGNLSTPQMVYAFDPAPRDVFTAAQAAHILGVQGNMWTEYIGSTSYLWYMLFPREFALSEIAWTPENALNWPSFDLRTGSQFAWLQRHGYSFRIPNPAFALDAGAPVVYDNVTSSVRNVSVHVSAGTPELRITQPIPGATILYAREGALTRDPSTPYTSPLHIALERGTAVDIRAVTRLSDGRTSTPSEIRIVRDL